MDHSLAIRKDPERVWDVPGSKTGSRRDRGRVHHRMSFRKRRQLRYAEELLRILMDRDDHHDSRIRTQLQVHRKKRKKLVHLPQTDAPDILPIQTK